MVEVGRSNGPHVARAREAWQLRSATAASLISTSKEFRAANPILSGRGAPYKSSGGLEHPPHRSRVAGEYFCQAVPSPLINRPGLLLKADVFKGQGQYNAQQRRSKNEPVPATSQVARKKTGPWLRRRPLLFASTWESTVMVSRTVAAQALRREALTVLPLRRRPPGVATRDFPRWTTNLNSQSLNCWGRRAVSHGPSLERQQQ